MADRVVAVTVETSGPVAVVRRTTSGTWAVNDSPGVAAPERTWHFADGSTADGLDQFLLVFNPNRTDVEVEYLYSDARRQVLRRVQRLPPGVRTTVWVNRDDPEVVGSDASSGGVPRAAASSIIGHVVR